MKSWNQVTHANHYFWHCHTWDFCTASSWRFYSSLTPNQHGYSGNCNVSSSNHPLTIVNWLQGGTNTTHQNFGPGSLVGQSVKNSSPRQETAMHENVGSIPGSGRSPGEGNGNPLQYSCLENSTDRGAWEAAVHGVTRVVHDLVT